MNQTFEISSEYIELNKLLKASGLYYSGEIAKMVIEDGLITLDGVIDRLINADYDASQTVYGYFNDLVIEAKGRLLARIFKEF